MLKWLIRNRLKAFETRYGYDASYMRELLDTDFAAFAAFARLQKLGRYRKDIPTDVVVAVTLVTVLSEDCGPCTQLVVAMALETGVKPQTIAAVLENTEVLMSDDVRLGVKFARAIITRDASADELRDEIVRRWGKRALTSLAFGMVSARVFPTVKYAMGHGKACTRLLVDGQPVIPHRAPETPAHVLRAMS